MPGKFYAAIDMGTNSFHLIIVEVKPDGSFKAVDSEREVIRLGSQEGEDLQVISAGETEKAINILLQFKKLAEHYNAPLRAIATSAVREAQNKNSFIDTVLKETGIKVEAVPGGKEAEYIYKGTEKALELGDKKALCIDIGGGSTEFIYADSGKIIFAESIKIGAVRLSKRFFPGFNLSEESIEECENFIEKEILTNENIQFNADFENAAGSSGTIQSAAGTIYFQKFKEQPKSFNNFTFSKKEFESVYHEILSKKTPAERELIPGIEIKRVDILPAGLIILKKAFDFFDIKELTVSGYALREGIILDTIQNGNNAIP